MKNWFQQYLNWTFAIIYGVGVIVPSDLLLLLFIAEKYYSTGLIPTWFQILEGFTGLAIMLSGAIWTLKQKNRSMWWLLLSGWFSPLWLTDKSSFVNNTVESHY